MRRNVTFVEKDSQKSLLKIKIIKKLETIAILQVNTKVQHIAYVIEDLMCLMKIPVVFHNGSNYDYQFIIKELTNEFDGQFECLGKNTEKYKTCYVPRKEEIRKVNKDCWTILKPFSTK